MVAGSRSRRGQDASRGSTVRAEMLAEKCLEGKVAIITGGGTGIGLAIAKRFGALGATLVIGSRNARNLERGNAELRLAGYDSLAGQIDVRKTEQVDARGDRGN